MSQELSAIKKELSRVRSLKRATEAEITMLREHMENGKLHIRVNENKEFRQDLAKSMVKISSPDYSITYQGGYDVDPVRGKVYYSHPSQFQQYSEDVAYRIVDISELFDENCNYSDETDWNLCQSEIDFFNQLVDEYLEFEGEKREDNGDTPDWIDYKEVCRWGLRNGSFQCELQEIEQKTSKNAVSFALENIKDEIIIEL